MCRKLIVVIGSIWWLLASILYAEPTVSPITFHSIWGYMLIGDEVSLSLKEPLTDIFYFGASVSATGSVHAVVNRPKITFLNGSSPAIHVVISETAYNAALMHFCLKENSRTRELLLNDIVRVSRGFDGVQLDFETILSEDAPYFFSFLETLKKRLPRQMVLSVAIPARVGGVKNDPFQYKKLASIVDLIVIMAYDEHWSTSEPGSVASLPWCEKVVTYAKSQIPSNKLLMGLPLYGRSWPDKKYNRGLVFKQVQNLMTQYQGTANYTVETGPYFEFQDTLRVKVFYEDDRSLAEKLKLYQYANIQGVAFWRIGQESKDLWGKLGLMPKP